MRKENIKYKALTAIRYLGDGFFYPFFALYLVSRGLLEARIGFILSISPLLAILMNPIYAKICNKIKKTRITLGIISILEGLMILLIGFSSNFYFITVLAIFMAIFGACHYGLMDSLLAIYSDNSKQNYSGFRLYGSGAYIIATAASGYICKLVSYQVAFGISFGLFVISGILYLVLKDINIEEEQDITKKDSVDYKVVLSNKRFVFFMFFYGLMLALIFTNNNFFGTYLETRGVDSDGYGLVFSYFVAVELVVLLVLNKIKKKTSPYVLLIISAISLVIRLLVCYLYAPVWLVIVSSGLRGIGYGIILHVSYQYVIDLVGEDKATKGIMLCTLVYSILLFAFNNINGNLIEAYGYKNYYLINLIASIVLLIYSALIPFFNKKKIDDRIDE
ncbi:MAG: MFS transporter [Bacilli bacterium]|nr:MFS transporter [Bacilli bacterium]